MCLIQGDLLDQETLNQTMRSIDAVFHMAAMPTFDLARTTHKDLEQNTIATFNTLEAMRLNKVKCIATSQPAQYMIQLFLRRKTHHFRTTSLYGASKLAQKA